MLSMKSLSREPLVHFLLLGAALFVLSGLLDRTDRGGPRTIVITGGQIEHLTTVFTRTWQRPPSAEELAGLVRDRVRQEVYYREALTRGLDRDDVVIRRRLQQKLEFLTADIAAMAEPTEAELETFLQTYAGRFRVDGTFSFEHVYLSPARRGEDLQRDAVALLARLREADGTPEGETMGDPFLLANRFQAMPGSEIANLFGEDFATALNDTPPGDWHGPLTSAYGAHLVRVAARSESRLPALAEVREGVRREWLAARQRRAAEDFYRSLLDGYTVIVEDPRVDDTRRQPTDLAGLKVAPR